MSNGEFSDVLGITPAAVSDMIHGRVKKMSGPIIKLLELKYGVNPAWLLSGDGEMFLGGSAAPAQPVRQARKPAGLDPDDEKLLKEIIEAVVDIFEEEDLTLPGRKMAELIMLLFEDLKKDVIQNDNVRERALKLIKIAV